MWSSSSDAGYPLMKLRAVSIGLDQRTVSQDTLQFSGKVKLVDVGYAGVAYYLDIFWRCEREHTVSITHRFE